MEFDVVVVGSGAGALVGALTAASQGLGTVVLEKAAVLGGTSAYSGGAMFLPGNALTVGAGLPDSVARGRTYLRALLGDGDADRLEAFLETGPELLDFLGSHRALAFERTSMPEYFDVPGRLAGGGQVTPVPLPLSDVDPEVLSLVRPGIGADRRGLVGDQDPLWGGRALVARLLTALLATGRATVHTRTTVDALVVGDDGVVGVEAQSDGGRVVVRARRGVLLASGGFERNGLLRERYGVPGRAEHSMAPAGTNTGEPIEAALRIGAATAHLGQAWLCPALVEPDGSAAFVLGARSGLVVDLEGRRFANESLPYDRFGREMAASAPSAWFVFDSREGGRLPAVRCVPGTRREDYLASGAWVQGGSVEELAELMGAAALPATVARFNALADQGVDEDFGRGEDEFDRFWARGDGPNPCLLPLDRPPYLAARLVLGDLGTKGGLMTDADANVLREDRSLIRGLYAAGNTMAAVTGGVYPAPGTPIGMAAVFAHRAARRMVQLPST